MWSVKCGVWSVQCTVQSVECKVWSVEPRVSQPRGFLHSSLCSCWTMMVIERVERGGVESGGHG